MELPATARIGVLGAGALGGYVGARLAHAGEAVHFLLRGDLATVREEGWRIRSVGENDFQIKPAACYGSAEDLGPVDLVIIGLKTTENLHLEALLSPLLQADTVVVTLQNGLGVAEALQERLPKHPVLAGVCHIAATRIAPGVIANQVPRGGRIRLAPVDPAHFSLAESLAARIDTSGIRCEALASIDEAVWRKLMWNVPFNGVPVALGGSSLDTLFADDSLLQLVGSLMTELRLAAEAQGCVIPPTYADELIEFTRGFGTYRSSTVIDFLAGRPLEIEVIWGEPLRRGTEAGVSMPHLATLCALLKGLDAQRSAEPPST